MSTRHLLFSPKPADIDGESVFIHKISVLIPELLQQKLSGEHLPRIAAEYFLKSRNSVGVSASGCPFFLTVMEEKSTSIFLQR